MSTTVVTPENFDRLFPAAMRVQHWALVQYALIEVFDVSEKDAVGAVEGYQESLAGARESEQIAAYHEHPLSVAATLAGVDEVTEHHQRDYRERVAHHVRSFDAD